MIIDFFHKLRHWQLFILLFGVPILLQIYFMSFTLDNIADPNVDPDEIAAQFKTFFVLFPLIMIITMGSLFAWLWSIGVGLHKKLPDQLKINIKRFKIFFFIPVIYIALVSLFMSSLFATITMNPEPNVVAPQFKTLSIILPFVILLHLFSIFCIFHTLYFCAKIFKTFELKKPVVFNDFVGEFFLLWFSFIGVWILQPKLNQLGLDDGEHSFEVYDDDFRDNILDI